MEELHPPHLVARTLALVSDENILHPDTALGVRLSAIMARHQFDVDPRSAVDELLQVAGARGDVLAREAGLWAGAHHGSEHHRPMVTALEGIPGARQWIELGRKRAGMLHRTIDPQ